jgi:hypothetical protein
MSSIGDPVGDRKILQRLSGGNQPVIALLLWVEPQSLTTQMGEFSMALEDGVCTLVPYFTVQDGKLDEFKSLGEKMVEKTKSESAVCFYGFSFSGQRAHCREGYTDAAGVLAHLENVGELLGEALKIAKIDLLEVHGPAAELEKLQEPLKDLNPVYFTMETGFRR